MEGKCALSGSTPGTPNSVFTLAANSFKSIPGCFLSRYSFFALLITARNGHVATAKRSRVTVGNLIFGPATLLAAASNSSIPGSPAYTSAAPPPTAACFSASRRDTFFIFASSRAATPGRALAFAFRSRVNPDCTLSFSLYTCTSRLCECPRHNAPAAPNKRAHSVKGGFLDSVPPSVLGETQPPPRGIHYG